eukprot:4765463-Amphidinium_carterae.1
MEPEALAPYGYEVPDSSGARDKLDKSANLVATVGALSMSDRAIGGVAVSLMFVFAAGYAPVRAAASQEMEVVTFMDHRHQSDGDVVWSMVLSSLLQQMKPPTRDQSTQTTTTLDREIGTTRVREVDDDIFVYPQGRRCHTTWNCRAVKSRNRDSTVL